MTQLKLKPGSFFICGPILKDLNEAETNFCKCEEVLNSHGLNTVNQFLLYNSKGFTPEHVKYTIMHLIGCNTLVTLPNWASCNFAKKQVEIARILDIDVVCYSKLALSLNEKNA